MKNDDLLNIGNNDNKKNLRKILIYAAIGFLIFVIAIIAVALYQNKSSKEENAILPPQVSEQNTQLFKEVPIEKNEVGNEKVETNNSANSIKPKTETKTQNIVSEKNVTSTVKNIAVPMETPKKNAEVKHKSKKHQQKKVFKTKYYIQVAALLRNSKPNKKFLNLINKYGYKYIFYTAYIKKGNEKIKVTKVLVGPFKNKKEAIQNLAKIKKYITSNAFIFKVK